ncbi:MAG: hypothetical protein G01um101477_17 [Candidatus Doudnabacteria bacterium Gr01-1014_77]|uniref:Uncharacterized protein n=1 Tax=Candidatus Doudnabacteria bacterium Gr01-1014_77 TaxID=2017133 RepID=A0A554JEC0_9BACT|nr:MAG: hypothetical protein G01um101477_17 [Candidatus Doudnabacteria bacterium Gr01-1014_77]
MWCSRRLRVDSGRGGRRLVGRLLRGKVVDHEETDDSHDDDDKRDQPNAWAFGLGLLVHGSSCDPSQVEVKIYCILRGGFIAYCHIYFKKSSTEKHPKERSLGYLDYTYLNFLYYFCNISRFRNRVFVAV